MPRLVMLIVLLCSLMIAGTTALSAQEASPVAGTATCDVEPRTADELLALWYGEDGTPTGSWATPVAGDVTAGTSIPTGTPADEATTAAITVVIEQVFTCFDAGNFLGAYALFTDDLVSLFGPEPGTSFEDAQAFLTAPAEPAPAGEESEIVGVTNAVVLDDGRVGAFVIDQFAGTMSTSYAIFEQEGEQWLVDEVIEFPSPIDEE